MTRRPTSVVVLMSAAEIAAKREEMRLRLLKRRDPLAHRAEMDARRNDRRLREASARVAAQEAAELVRVRATALPDLDAYDQHRLWQKVRRGAPDACWPWQGARAAKGYSRFKVGGKLYSPHRLIYALANGGIVNVREVHGSVVMHACDNPRCCNPAHLRLGRQADNVHDMDAKGRRRRPTCSALPASAGRD